MRYQFKQALLIERHRFSLGNHEVSHEVTKTDAFQHFLKVGVIVPLKHQKVTSFEELPVLTKPKSDAAKRAEASVAQQKAASEATAGQQAVSETSAPPSEELPAEPEFPAETSDEEKTEKVSLKKRK